MSLPADHEQMLDLMRSNCEEGYRCLYSAAAGSQRIDACCARCRIVLEANEGSVVSATEDAVLRSVSGSNTVGALKDARREGDGLRAAMDVMDALKWKVSLNAGPGRNESAEKYSESRRRR
ncbi:cyclin-dependent protein kinase inhibitor [Pseudozyma hubeiensis SY62]|uniref:Cyclin-dependent protein kinase inhibitor n=1 Tax=Pseudozyma hubeiensis (strain SY62) TaxID=1305764 RepID=R9P9L4_PSEHS|nr:cyclin-dependent protein kinase inhibitor [Pseudozyma hubeiensis SY62]GAC98039.1 cyclin-dependent protein kinase inhibitor [Pseudozyma hubeiensis SY62]